MKKKRNTLTRLIRNAKSDEAKSSLAIYGSKTESESEPIKAFFFLAQAFPTKIDSKTRKVLSKIFRTSLESRFIDAILTLDLEFFETTKNTIVRLNCWSDTIIGMDHLRSKMMSLKMLEDHANSDPWFKNYMTTQGINTDSKKISELQKVFKDYSEHQIRRAAKDVGLKIARSKVGRKIGTRNREY